MYTSTIGGAFVNTSGNLQDFDIDTAFEQVKQNASGYAEGAASNLFTKAKDAAIDFFSPSTAPATPPTVQPPAQPPALPPLSRPAPTLPTPPQSDTIVERNRGIIAKLPAPVIGASVGGGAYYLTKNLWIGIGSGIATTVLLNRMKKRDAQ